MPLSMLTAICAVAEGALPEREPMPRIFAGLLRLIPRLPLGEQLLAELIRWELVVLSDLGYGLDLSACAVTGRTGGLAHVSPRTGRAVTHEGAGQWAARLLPLPAFLVDTPSGDLADTPRGVLVNAPRGVLVNAPRGVPVNAPRGVLADTPPGDPVDTPPDYAGWRDGLRLTGHFLARDAFGHQHRPLPQARAMLYDRVAALAVKHGAAPLEAAEQEKDDTSNNAG
jgi:DNA repair protein RecO (recombination protein O)